MSHGIMCIIYINRPSVLMETNNSLITINKDHVLVLHGLLGKTKESVVNAMRVHTQTANKLGNGFVNHTSISTRTGERNGAAMTQNLVLVKVLKRFHAVAFMAVGHHGLHVINHVLIKMKYQLELDSAIVMIQL